VLLPGSDLLVNGRFSPWRYGESGSECAGCWKLTQMGVKGVTAPAIADLSPIRNSSGIFI